MFAVSFSHEKRFETGYHFCYNRFKSRFLVAHFSSLMPAETHTSHAPSFSALVAVIEKSVLGMDQKLGYPGRERFVIFYYELRGEEVIWRDRRSYGFATGAWTTFKEELAPVADLYGVEIGSEVSPARHVLLIDRADHRAYFVERTQALQFIDAVADDHQSSIRGMAGGATAAGFPKTLEVTQETVARLAYEIWERKGRMEGHYLDDWLEAEAQLTAAARQAASRKQS